MKRLLVLLLPLLLARGAGADVVCSTTQQTCASGGSTVSEYTVAALPASPGDDELLAIVTDGNAAGDCTTGGGSTRGLCGWTGSAWAAIGDGNSGAAPTFADIGSGSNTTATMICGTGCAITTGGSGTVDATTAAELSANGANCGAGEWAAGVDAAGAAEGCTADDDVPDAGEVGDTALAAGAVDGGAGGEIADGSITADDLAADSITEAKLKAVDAASDEECLTYETTTGDFEWQSCGGSSGITLLCKGAAATTTTGTTEEAVATCTVAANTLSEKGHALRVTWQAITAATANTKQIRIRVGGVAGTLVMDSGAVASNAQQWTSTAPLVVTRTGASTASAAGAMGRASSGGGTNLSLTTNFGATVDDSVSVDWTASQDLVITMTTPTASGDMTLVAYQVELLK